MKKIIIYIGNKRKQYKKRFIRKKRISKDVKKSVVSSVTFSKNIVVNVFECICKLIKYKYEMLKKLLLFCFEYKKSVASFLAIFLVSFMSYYFKLNPLDYTSKVKPFIESLLPKGDTNQVNEISVTNTVVVTNFVVKEVTVTNKVNNSSPISTNVLILIQKDDPNSVNSKLRKQAIPGYYLEDSGFNGQHYQNNFVPNRYLYIK